jgi:hypothetical protein
MKDFRKDISVTFSDNYDKFYFLILCVREGFVNVLWRLVLECLPSALASFRSSSFLCTPGKSCFLYFLCHRSAGIIQGIHSFLQRLNVISCTASNTKRHRTSQVGNCLRRQRIILPKLCWNFLNTHTHTHTHTRYTKCVCVCVRVQLQLTTPSKKRVPCFYVCTSQNTFCIHPKFNFYMPYHTRNYLHNDYFFWKILLL